MPGINEFKGPVSVSVSVPHACAMGEGIYIMHGGLEPRFSVLKFSTKWHLSRWEVWHWQSLPPPPFVYKQPTISYPSCTNNPTTHHTTKQLSIYMFHRTPVMHTTVPSYW
jgi:hypothetical protein